MQPQWRHDAEETISCFEFFPATLAPFLLRDLAAWMPGGFPEEPISTDIAGWHEP